MSRMSQAAYADDAKRRYGHWAGVRHCARIGIDLDIALWIFAGRV